MDKSRIIGILDKIIEWALYLLIFSIPFSKTAIEACITIGFIAWASKKIILRDFTLKKTPLRNLLFAFFAITLISFVNAEFKMLFMRSLVSKCLKYIILYFVMVESLDSETKFKNLLKMAFISASIVAIDGYIQYFILHVDVLKFYPSFKYAPLTDVAGHLGFPTGPFPFPNDLSAWMLMVLLPLFALFLWGGKETRVRALLGSLLLPLGFLFYLASARSAWCGFFISAGAMFFIRSKKIFILFVALLLIIAFIMPAFLSGAKINEIFTFSSMHDRFYMWRIGWKIFTEHPVIGNGLNMFFSKFREYREDEYRNKLGSYAHNGFLQIAAETGIIGLLVFLLLIARVFSSVFRYIRESESAFYRAFALGLASGVLAFLIQSFFDTNLQSLPLAALFWFSLALLGSLEGIHGRKI
jgi:putative inorganic carbon (HCO3(-)) transporter